MKTEKEKMLGGEYYNALDDVLVRERELVRSLTFEFNHTLPSEVEKRSQIMKKLIRARGSFLIEAPFNCDYGYNIEVGEGFFANFNCVMLDVNKIKIGNNVLLGPNVQVYTATHPINPRERLEGLEYGLPVTIGNNVWIGGGAIICPGVQIGDNVVVGAGSVVTSDIPDNVVAAGNPCRIIKKID